MVDLSCPLIWWLVLTVYRDLHKEGGLLVCSLSMDSDSSLRFGRDLKSSRRGFISTVVVTVNLNLHFHRTYLEVRKFIRSTLSWRWRVSLIMSNDHPFYYGLVFTVIMIYMPAASSHQLSFAILEITSVERCHRSWLAAPARSRQ